jgi:hypothetical protein
MGQYYVLINLDKRQALSCLRRVTKTGYFSLHAPWWSGSKLAEQLLNQGVKPLFALLLSSQGLVQGWHKVNQQWGTWAGDRVVIIGDYSDDLPPFLMAAEKTELTEAKLNVFSFASEYYQELENENVF